MPAKLIQVTFGAQAGPKLEEEIQWLYTRLPEDDREIMTFVRNDRVNTALMVQAGKSIKFYGPAAMKFMYSYARVAHSIVYADHRIATHQTLPESGAMDSRLAHMIEAPYAQVSDSAPTTGHYYQYHPKQYLPEERRGPPARTQSYDLPRRIPRDPLFHFDGRTRVPANH